MTIENLNTINNNDNYNSVAYNYDNNQQLFTGIQLALNYV